MRYLIIIAILLIGAGVYFLNDPTALDAPNSVSKPQKNAEMNNTSTSIENTAPSAGESKKENKDADEVIARVNDQPIYRHQLTMMMENLPPQLANFPEDQLESMLISNLIDQEIIAGAARKANIQNTKEYKDQLAMTKDRILSQVYLQQQAEKAISEKTLRAHYQELIKDVKDQKEVHARHILVKTKEEAEEVLEMLAADDADFAAIAQEKSIDPSKAMGGDLGWFTRDRMVKPFADAAFSMKPGEISKEPVKSEFGYHIIKLEERRNVEPPKFEEVKEGVKKSLKEKIIKEKVEKLKKSANIENLMEEELERRAQEREKAQAEAAEKALEEAQKKNQENEADKAAE